MRYAREHDNERPRNQRSQRPPQRGGRLRPSSYEDDPFAPRTGYGQPPRGASRPRRSGTLDLPEREDARRRDGQRRGRKGRRMDSRDSNRMDEERRAHRGAQGRPRSQGASHAASAQAHRSYRPDDSRENYARSSQRYARSAGAGNMSAQRNRPMSGSGHAPIQANQYGRERYVRQPGQQRAMPVSQQNFDKARKPVNPTALVALGVVAIVLVAFIAIRFILFGSTAAQFEAMQSDIRQEQTQLDELTASNDELQQQIDSWQPTIDEYEARTK